MDRSPWEPRRRTRRRRGSGRGASAAPAPAPRRGAGEVAGPGGSRHHDRVASLYMAVGYRVVEVDRDAGTEQVAALLEGVPMAFGGQFERFAPIAQKRPVGLVGDHQIDVFG